MAFSGSLQKGQIPIACKLCEADTNIKWKCLDCDLLICTKCKEFHGKIKTSKEHKIIDIKEVGKHTKDIDFDNIKCQQHGGQVNCMFCKSCNKLVCPICIAGVHNSHKLAPIDEIYKDHIGKLKEAQKTLEIDMNKIYTNQKRIQEIRKTESKKYSDIKKQIQDHNATLKREIDKYTEKLMKDLDKAWISLQNAFDEEQKRLSSVKQSMESCQFKSEALIKSGNVEQLFGECEILEKSMNDVVDATKRIDFSSVPIFIPGEITEHNLGSLQQDPIGIKINILQQYKTDFSVVHFLKTASDESVWICDSDNKKIQRVNAQGDKLKLAAFLNIAIYGMAVISSGNLLVVDNNNLKQINKITCEVTDSKYKVNPLFPTAIHTRDGKVMAGAWDGKDSGRRVLVVMDREGGHEHFYEYNKTRERLFSYVQDITSTEKGKIIVVDKFSMENIGRVVVLQGDQGVLNTYNGNPSINTKIHPFRPSRAATTELDNVIVSDMYMHVLHILSNHGNPIAYCNTKEIGIMYPVSLGFDKSGELYIGCNTAPGSKDRAKLYKVNMSGC